SSLAMKLVKKSWIKTGIHTVFLILPRGAYPNAFHAFGLVGRFPLLALESKLSSLAMKLVKKSWIKTGIHTVFLILPRGAYPNAFHAFGLVGRFPLLALESKLSSLATKLLKKHGLKQEYMLCS
ncbi:MAG: hypothetical protein MH132_01675, partial [Hydrotalea sp.]|nr:hypothetical protein [Hydrotalea sp.]